jgi:hypothetical protein
MPLSGTLEGIFYMSQTGIQWKALSKEYGSASNARQYFGREPVSFGGCGGKKPHGPGKKGTKPLSVPDRAPPMAWNFARPGLAVLPPSNNTLSVPDRAPPMARIFVKPGAGARRATAIQQHAARALLGASLADPSDLTFARMYPSAAHYRFTRWHRQFRLGGLASLP